jgi:hypothetical protein
MTTQQTILWSSAYLVELVVVLYFTRATWRRALGALAGGAVVGVMGLGAIAACERLGWWRVPLAPEPYALALFYVGLVISVVPIYLVTWRTVRRFGWRGLAAWVGGVAIIGPPRDYFIAARFPSWMVFSPGLAPMFADSVTYMGIVAVGHAVMHVISGPARADRLARTPPEAG